MTDSPPRWADDAADDAASALPPRGPDEPPALRSAIRDELADHLACAHRRALLRTGDADDAAADVLSRFGDPRAVAAHLWLDAMKGRLMTQKLTLALAALAATLSLVACGVLLKLGLDSQRTNAALVERAGEANAALLAKLETLGSGPGGVLRTPEWVSLKIRCVYGTPDGPPADDVWIDVEGPHAAPSDVGGGIAVHGRELDAAGELTRVMARIGRYSFSAVTPAGYVHSGDFELLPGRAFETVLVCPPPPHTVPVSIDVVPEVAGGADLAYGLRLFQAEPLTLHGIQWTYGSASRNGVGAVVTPDGAVTFPASGILPETRELPAGTAWRVGLIEAAVPATDAAADGPPAARYAPIARTAYPLMFAGGFGYGSGGGGGLGGGFGSPLPPPVFTGAGGADAAPPALGFGGGAFSVPPDDGGPIDEPAADEPAAAPTLTTPETGTAEWTVELPDAMRAQIAAFLAERDGTDGLIEGDAVVAVVCHAPADVKARPGNGTIEREVAREVAASFTANNVAVRSPDDVAAWLGANPDWEKPGEVGGALAADVVLLIDLTRFSLEEPNSTDLHRGRAEAVVRLFKMESDGDADNVFAGEVVSRYPSARPRSASAQSAADFREEYLERLGEEIAALWPAR